MNVPLRTSFVRTITPQAASPNDAGTAQTSSKQRPARQNRDSKNKTSELAISMSLEPSEANRDEAFLAPGCGRTFCKQCSFPNTLT
jgi:hypothetical protein